MIKEKQEFYLIICTGETENCFKSKTHYTTEKSAKAGLKSEITSTKKQITRWEDELASGCYADLEGFRIRTQNWLTEAQEKLARLNEAKIKKIIVETSYKFEE